PEEIAILGRGAVGQELGEGRDLDLAGHGAVGGLGRIHARISNRNFPCCVGRTHGTSAFALRSPRGAADSVLPSPLWGGWRAQRAGWGSCSDARVSSQAWTPTPNPSPQGGGEQTEFVARGHPRLLV